MKRSSDNSNSNSNSNNITPTDDSKILLDKIAQDFHGVGGNNDKPHKFARPGVNLKKVPFLGDAYRGLYNLLDSDDIVNLVQSHGFGKTTNVRRLTEEFIVVPYSMCQYDFSCFIGRHTYSLPKFNDAKYADTDAKSIVFQDLVQLILVAPLVLISELIEGCYDIDVHKSEHRDRLFEMLHRRSNDVATWISEWVKTKSEELGIFESSDTSDRAPNDVVDDNAVSTAESLPNSIVEFPPTPLVDENSLRSEDLSSDEHEHDGGGGRWRNVRRFVLDEQTNKLANENFSEIFDKKFGKIFRGIKIVLLVDNFQYATPYYRHNENYVYNVVGAVKSVMKGLYSNSLLFRPKCMLSSTSHFMFDKFFDENVGQVSTLDTVLNVDDMAKQIEELYDVDVKSHKHKHKLDMFTCPYHYGTLLDKLRFSFTKSTETSEEWLSNSIGEAYENIISGVISGYKTLMRNENVYGVGGKWNIKLLEEVRETEKRIQNEGIVHTDGDTVSNTTTEVRGLSLLKLMYKYGVTEEETEKLYQDILNLVRSGFVRYDCSGTELITTDDFVKKVMDGKLGYYYFAQKFP